MFCGQDARAYLGLKRFMRNFNLRTCNLNGVLLAKLRCLVTLKAAVVDARLYHKVSIEYQVAE